MNPDFTRDAFAVLEEALELPPERRVEYVDRVCAGNEVLAAAVRKLLLHADPTESALDLPAAVALGEEGAAETGEPWQGRRIGRYTLLRRIGEGGMSSVFLAESQADELSQNVALKLFRGGPGQADLERRFRAERRILAGLDHPSIARFLDGGSTEEGVPYLVTEYVEGSSLTRYCDASRLDARRRLELFLEVCEAVSFAHRQLVVHRDLKPSNVLVTPAGQPKLLDFGIAKVLAPEEVDAGAAATATVGRILTPNYCSPEQIAGRRVGTASDVYSLGVVLFELLAGRPPRDWRYHTIVEISEGLSTGPPPRPSEALQATDTADAERLREVANRRGTQVEALRRSLQGDLDAIVQRALAVDPRERYPSVEQLAADLQRHLAGHPVRARRATLVYRAGKFVRRHAAAVAAVAIVVALLGVFQARTLRERDRAAAAAAEAEQLSSFLVDLFSKADPARTRGADFSVRELLDAGVERAGVELADQPIVLGTLLHRMGVAYLQLGAHRDALPVLERALAVRERALADAAGERDELETSIADTLSDLGAVHFRLGDYDAAEPLFERSLEVRRRVLGPGHADVGNSLHNLGFLYLQRGDREKAKAYYREALAVFERGGLTAGPRLDRVALTHTNLAHVYAAEHQFDLAERHSALAVAILEPLPGPLHPYLADALGAQGAAHYYKGEYRQARTLFERVVEVNTEILGPDHPRVGGDLNNVADAAIELDELDYAAELYARSLAIHEKLGAAHPELAFPLVGLANVALRQGDPEEAEGQARRALAITEQSYPEGHPLRAERSLVLARALSRQGSADDARPLYELALAFYAAALEREPDAPGTRAELAAALIAAAGAPASAAATPEDRARLERAAELMAPLVGDPDALSYAALRAKALLRLGRQEEARPLVERLRAAGWRDRELDELAASPPVASTSQ